MIPRAGWAIAATAALALCGCDEVFQNRTARSLEHAEQKEKEGDYHAAVQFYEASLDGSPKGADVHYRLALIYDDKIKDPISATHHFQRYLALSPRGPHARDARKFIQEDELKIATALGKGAYMTREDAVRLKNDNLELRKQLTDLRAQRAAPPPIATGNGSPVQKPIPPGAKTYVVKKGDTLATISHKVFNTSARWKDIQDANFNALSGTVKLKPGMTLIIPNR